MLWYEAVSFFGANYDSTEQVHFPNGRLLIRRHGMYDRPNLVIPPSFIDS